MPTPKTHYRIALGEHNGQHSWIIHTSKGITWHNIPDELETLLKKLTVNELLDFSLGSDGRWFVRYRQKGPEKQELSPYLWMDLNQGSSVKLDRLTLGPDADHWGVHKATDGSFQRFSSVGNRDRFTALLDAKTDQIKSNNQIWFVSFGFRGDWAFSVNGYVQHRCGKPFHTELSNGWKVKKRVSTIVLSPMARVWIIVWEDGSLSHNLPSNIASEVEDYCQIQHSLKNNRPQQNPRRPKAQKPKPPRNNRQPASTAPSQTWQPGPNPTQSAGPGFTPYSTANTTQSAVPRTVNNTTNPPNVTSVPTAQRFPTSIPPPRPPAQSATNASITQASQVKTTSTSTRPAPSQLTSLSQAPKAPPVVKLTNTYQTRTASQADRPVSSVEPTPVPVRTYIRPRKLTTTLRLLDPYDWPESVEYEKVKKLFNSGWKHVHKRCPTIKSIYAIELPDHLNESYEAYTAILKGKNGPNGVNEKLVFHGTSRRCSIAEIRGYTSFCTESTCSLCSILRTSFLVSKAGSAGRTFKRFGPGIYTSSVSSKADDYANEPWNSDNKIIIVAKVALGKVSVHYRTTEDLTRPPYGYDSVLGEVGIDLNHDEQVLYDDDAIRPAYVIVYEQPTLGSLATTTTTARPQPVQTQTYTSTYKPYQPTTTASRPAQTTTTNWFGQPTTTTSNSSSSSGCTIM